MLDYPVRAVEWTTREQHVAEDSEEDSKEKQREEDDRNEDQTESDLRPLRPQRHLLLIGKQYENNDSFLYGKNTTLLR